MINLLCLFLCWPCVAVLACIKAYFSLCSCIFQHCCALLHVRCLTECPSDIFELNWIQVNSNFWVYTCLTFFNLLWSLIMCFTHFAHVAHTRHTPKHPLSNPMHLMLQSHASAHAYTCISTCTHMHTLLYSLYSCIVIMVSCSNTFSMMVMSVCSILSVICSVLRCFHFCLI